MSVAPEERERVLDPIARMSEVLFGLIMALTFTTTLELTAGRDDVRTLLVGVTGCNIAWGLVDAVMFLIASMIGRGHGFLTIRAVRAAARPDDAHRAIAAALPPVLSAILTRDDLDRVRQRLVGMPDLAPPTLTRDDWLGALAVFLLVFLSTCPVVVPFLFVAEVRTGRSAIEPGGDRDDVRRRLYAGKARRLQPVVDRAGLRRSRRRSRRDHDRAGRVACFSP